MNELLLLQSECGSLLGKAHGKRQRIINDWELGFNLGNTVKYISRAGRKDNAIQDLEKAKFYLEYEIKRLKSERTCPKCESNQDSVYKLCLNCGYDFREDK